MNYHHNNMKKYENSLQKEQNIIIGKQESIDLYDVGKRNTPKYHIPRYDGGK